MTISRTWLVSAAAAVVMVVLVILILASTDGGLGLLDAHGGRFAYFAIFATIAGDAVVPILPGETALNAAAVLASKGELELWLVVLVAALGAIVGDSALYWTARVAGGRLERQLDRMKTNPRIARALEIFGRRAPLLIVLGRYIPGVRFVVNATMGLTGMPYRTFLVWSSLGGALWATYTGLLAYAVGTAIADFPIASMVISGGLTTVLIAAVFWLESRRGSEGPAPDPSATDPHS